MIPAMPPRLSPRVLFLTGLSLATPLGGLRLARAAEKEAPVPLAPTTLAQGVNTNAVTKPAGAPKTPVVEKQTEVVSTTELSKDAQRALGLFWEAVACFRSTAETTRARGRQALEESASLELVQAQDFLGQCYLDGQNGFQKDLKKGVNWLRLSSEHGLGFSKVRLATCLLSGYGVKKDLKEAEILLRAAVASDASFNLLPPPTPEQGLSVPQGDSDSTLSGAMPVPQSERMRAEAHFLLGELYTMQAKHTQAQAEYLLAAKQGENGRAGHYKACIKAALNYAYGRGVPRDSRKAGELVEISRQLFKRMGSAYARSLVDTKQVDTFAQGDVEDQLQKQAAQEERRLAMEVASNLSNKNSPNYNVAEAFRWLELAVEDGQSWAMNALGLLYQDAKAGRLNPAKARELFKASAEKDGDGLAWGNYAICLEQGIGGPKDPVAAKSIFKKYQMGDMLSRLGYQGACPSAPMSYDTLNQFTVKLAEKDDPHALYLLGCYFLYGVRKEESNRLGFSMLSKAAKLGHEEALSQLGTFFMNLSQQSQGEQAVEYAKVAVTYLKQGADKGSITGMVNLGRCHQEGIGVVKDVDEAARIYEVCLQREAEQAVALNNLSQIYYARYGEAAMRLDESGMSEMRGKMLSLLEAADRKGFVLAAKNLAVLYYEGQLGKKDFKAAYQHFDDAANRGDIYARCMLGLMLERGEGVPVSYAEAAYHYRIAALGGDTFALEKLCRFYRLGLGVSRDPERALYWLRLWIKAGDARARLQIFDVLLEQGDAEGARKTLEQATTAELSQRLFQGGYNHRLGKLYEKGLGVPKDEEKGIRLRASALAYEDPDELVLSAREAIAAKRDREAVDFLNRAIRVGNYEANYLLGLLFFEGQRIKQNRPMAVALFRRAADGGHKDAKYFLARCTWAKVEGAPKFDEAYSLCVEAEEAGIVGATELRLDLEKTRAEGVK